MCTYTYINIVPFCLSVPASKITLITKQRVKMAQKPKQGIAVEWEPNTDGNKETANQREMRVSIDFPFSLTQFPKNFMSLFVFFT